MPRAPTYDGPQVADTPLRGGFQDANAYNAGAAGVARLTQGLDAAAQAADNINTRDITEKAFNAHAKLQQEWMAADVELRKTYRGTRADEYLAESQKWWKDAESRVAKDLNPQTQQFLNKALTQTKLQATAASRTFYETEKERAADMAAEAAISTEIQFAATEGTPEAFAVSRKKITAINATVAQRRNLDADTLAAMNMRSLTALHVGAIATMMDAPNGTTQAKAYFLANKTEIDATRHKGITTALEQAGRLEMKQGAADKIMASGLPLDVAMKQIEKDYAGEDEAAIKQEVTQRYAYQEAAITKAQQQAYGTAQLEYEQTGRVRPSTMSLLTDGHRADIIRRQKADAKAAVAAATAKDFKTDPKVHGALWAEMVDDPAKFLQRDLLSYRDRLSQADFEQLMTKRQALKAGGDKQDSLYSTLQRVEAVIKVADIDPKSDEALAIRTEVDRRLRRESAAQPGKALKPDDEQRIIDEVVTDKVFVSRSMWPDKETPLANVTSEQLKDAYVTVDGKDIKLSIVPQDDRAKIMSALRRAGLPVTEKSIVETYMKKARTTTGAIQ